MATAPASVARPGSDAGEMRIDILSEAKRQGHALTVCSIVHDELYVLPEFFRHYRALGVDRFLVLDDASTDGSREFLAAQPDCTVFTSDVRYFDIVNGRRALHAWRQELLDRYCMGQWALFPDADEFLVLPPGLGIRDVIATLEREGSRSIWGLMLDMYPETLAGMQPDGGPFRLDGGWCYDGGLHLIYRKGWNKPMTIYRGSRARLMAENGILDRDLGWFKRQAVALGFGGYLKHNMIFKVPLMLWQKGDVVEGSHQIAPRPTTSRILAILHFKFTPDTARKIDYALSTGGYYEGSRQYVALATLMERLAAKGGSFMGRRSKRFTDPGDPYRTGAGRWS